MIHTENGHVLAAYLAAAFPAVAVATYEEQRFIRSLVERWPQRSIYTIDTIGGLFDARTEQLIRPDMTYAGALTYLATQTDSVLVLLDWHKIAHNPPVYRALKRQLNRYKQLGNMVVPVTTPGYSLPPELQRDMPALSFALPTREQLDAALMPVVEGAGESLTPANKDACLDAAAGLTLTEAENAFALSYVRQRCFDPGPITAEKLLMIKQSGLLEVYQPVDPSLVGGLGNFKEYIAAEVLPNLAHPSLRVRGLLLVGISGTGKSLAAKTISAMVGWPVLRCNPGNLKGSLVGQSEANMRTMLALTEAIAPCVLFIDEAEKFYAGNASSGQTDGGTTSSMLSEQLTWMQEHASPIITVMTCNDHSKLPTELTRAGRIDEQFFVDLPTMSERVEIAAIHLRRFGCSSELAEDIARQTHEWTGAEIEQAIKSAARRTNAQITLDAMQAAIGRGRPISRVRATEIRALRDWAANTLRSANTPDGDTQAVPSSRRLQEV